MCSSSEKVCRLCMAGKGNFIPIFGMDQLESCTPSLQEKIMLCTEVKVSEEDGLPESICHRCLYQIEIWFSFKKLCLRTDGFLQSEVKKRDRQDTDSLTSMIEGSNSSECLDESEVCHAEETIEEIRTENSSLIPSSQSDCSQLIAPARVYSRTSKHRCQVCKQKFSSKQDLLVHKADMHSEESLPSTLQLKEPLTSIGSDNENVPFETSTVYQHTEENINCFVESISNEESAVSCGWDADLPKAFDDGNSKSESKSMHHLSLKYKNAHLYPCPFCGTLIQRISRHIENQHSNEPEVKTLMSLEKNSQSRRRVLENLRMQGIIRYNERVKETKKYKSVGGDRIVNKESCLITVKRKY